MNPASTVEAAQARRLTTSSEPSEASAPALPEETPAAEAAALLLLLRTGRLAASRYAELVEERASALDVLRRERLEGARQTNLFTNVEHSLEGELEAAAREIAAWRAQGMRMVTVLDARYPENLRAAHDRPPLLFVAGRLKPRDARGVAVIGSRAASTEGLRAATQLAEHLVVQGYTVVSGLAIGIDTAAHTAALRRGARTVAVIGTGLSRCYPAANVILQRRIAAQCAVVSQFLPDAPPSKQNFPMRNAVMSGIALATVVVEAAHTSGARIQARLALGQGRPVFLLESLLGQKWARDLAELPGVHVVASPDEVTTTLARLTSDAALVA